MLKSGRKWTDQVTDWLDVRALDAALKLLRRCTVCDVVVWQQQNMHFNRELNLILSLELQFC